MSEVNTAKKLGRTIMEQICINEGITTPLKTGSIAEALNAATAALEGTPDTTNTIIGAMLANQNAKDEVEEEPEEL